jgi:hypothetical protein
MALSYSTGFKNAVLATGSVKATFDDGYIRVYAASAIPADADAALVGTTTLVTYSDNDQGIGAGQGLDLDTTAVNGAIAKAVGQTWSGTSVAAGTGLFWRYIRSTDTGGASTTEVRIQGTIGGAGADLLVQSTSFSNTTLYTLDFFSLSIPNA